MSIVFMEFDSTDKIWFFTLGQFAALGYTFTFYHTHFNKQAGTFFSAWFQLSY